MKKRSVAIFAAREILNWLVIGGLLLAGWWLPTFGEQFGTADVDTARRVVGWADYASNFFGGLLFFAAMFLVWRRAHHVTVEPRGI